MLREAKTHDQYSPRRRADAGRIVSGAGVFDDRVFRGRGAPAAGEPRRRTQYLHLGVLFDRRHAGRSQQRPPRHGPRRHRRHRVRAGAGDLRRDRRRALPQRGSLRQAPPAGLPWHRCRRGLHRHLPAGQGGTAGRIPVHHPLGEHRRVPRGVPGYRDGFRALRDRPQPVHLFRRNRRDRHDAQFHRPSPGPRHRRQRRRSAHPPPDPQRLRGAADGVAGAAQHHQHQAHRGDRGDGGEPRGTDELRGPGTQRGPLAAPVGTIVQQILQPLADTLLPRTASRPGAFSPIADQPLDPQRGPRLRLCIGLPFLQVLSRVLRLDAERRTTVLQRRARGHHRLPAHLAGRPPWNTRPRRRRPAPETETEPTRH